VSILLAVLRELVGLLLPEMFKELRRPREVLILGGGEELRDAVADSVTAELGGSS
jgi:hypothetical protein